MRKVFFLFSILVITFSSCYTPLDNPYEQGTDKFPVLNAVLQPDSLIKVHLSYTAGLKDTITLFVEDAFVVIQSTEGWVDTLIYAGKGWYTGNKKSRSNETYRCLISIPDYPDIFASTTVPALTFIDDLVYTEDAGRGEEGEIISSIVFNISNDVSRKLFWEVKLTNRGLFHDFETNTEVYQVRDNEIIMTAGQDEVLQNEALPLNVFSNRKMSVDFYPVFLKFNERSVSSSDLFIELRTVDESYYNYQKQLYLYNTSGGTGLGTSPQAYPLYSNVENALGMFTSYASYSEELIFNN